MSCYGRYLQRQVLLEDLRREIEIKLLDLGFVVVEAQDLGHSVVFRIRKRLVVPEENKEVKK